MACPLFSPRIWIKRVGTAQGRLCPPYGSPFYILPFRVHQMIGAAFERVIGGERLGVGERQVLHHDHAGDAAALIDPEEGVVDAAPTEAPGGALARHLIR